MRVLTAPSRMAPPEVREAWSQYLDELRETHPLRYPEVEPWAWARLEAKLKELKTRKAA